MVTLGRHGSEGYIQIDDKVGSFVSDIPYCVGSIDNSKIVLTV